MAETKVDDADDHTLILTPKKAALTWLLFTLAAFLLNDVLGLINKGGIFPLILSLNDAQMHSHSINISDSALRIVFISISTLLTVLIAAIYKLNIYDRHISFAMIAVAMGGGYLIDGFNDQKIMDRILGSYGYTYAPSGDFKVGHGKGSVYFHHYILKSATGPTSQRESRGHRLVSS